METKPLSTALQVRRDAIVKSLIDDGFVFLGSSYVREMNDGRWICAVVVDPWGRVTTYKLVAGKPETVITKCGLAKYADNVLGDIHDAMYWHL